MPKSYSRSAKCVRNLVYPLVEAHERVRRGLQPWEDWNGFYVDHEGCEYPITLNIDAEDLNGLYAVLGDDMPDEWFEAIQRSAFVLGYEWSNDTQEFVPIGKGGQYRFDEERKEWIAL